MVPNPNHCGDNSAARGAPENKRRDVSLRLRRANNSAKAAIAKLDSRVGNELRDRTTLCCPWIRLHAAPLKKYADGVQLCIDCHWSALA